MEGGCYRKLKGIGGDLPSGGGLEKTCLLEQGGGKDLRSAGPCLPVFLRTELKQ